MNWLYTSLTFFIVGALLQPTDASAQPVCSSPLPACELVCNGTFEHFDPLYSPYNNVNNAPPWTMIWNPEYFHTDPAIAYNPPGSILPHGGDAYTGFVSFFNNSVVNTGTVYPDPREMIKIELQDPLEDQEWVYAEMYVAGGGHPGGLPYGSAGQADIAEMHFSSGVGPTYLSYPSSPPVPQISSIDANGNPTVSPFGTSWQQVDGVFEVNGASLDHLTIGNFRSQAYSVSRLGSASDPYAYLRIDDVSVKVLPGAGDDTYACGTTSLQGQIGTGSCSAGDPDLSFYWTPTTGLSNPNSLTPTATVTSTTTYTLHVTYRGYSYTDDVTVNAGPHLSNSRDVACSGTVLYNLGNYDNQASYSLISTSGFTYSSNSLGSQIEFTGVNVTAPNGIGTFQVEVSRTLNGTTYSCTLTGYVLDCCVSPTYDYAMADEAMSNYFSSGTVVGNREFWIYGNVEIDIHIDFDNCKFFLAPDATLEIRDGMKVAFFGSDFDALCDYRWNNVLAQGKKSPITFIGCTVSKSMLGITLSDDKPSTIKDTRFYDNMVGVYFSRISSQGSFPNHAIHIFEGNELDVSSGSFNFLQHPSSSVNLSSVAPGLSSHTQSYLVVLEECELVSLGYQGSATNFFYPNTFSQGEGQPAKTVTGVYAQSSFYYIEKGEFDGSWNAVEASSSTSNIGSPDGENSFNGTPVETIYGWTYIDQNTFSNHSRIKIDYPSNHSSYSVQVTENDLSNNSHCVVNGNGGSNYRGVRAYRNDFNNSVIQYWFIPASGSKKVIIHSNTFWYNDTWRTAIDLNNCNSGIVAHNTLTSTYPTSNANTGILNFNSRNATVKNNTLSGFDYGISGQEDISNSQFSCNAISNGIFGFHFDNALLSTQGSASVGTGNTWVNCTADMGGNLDPAISSVNWYQHAPGGPSSAPYLSILGGSPLSGVVIPQNGATTNNACTTVPSSKSDGHSSDEMAELTEPQMSIYPNPTQDRVTITVPSELIGQALTVHSTTGSLVTSIMLTSLTTEMNVSALAEGMYFVRAGDQVQQLAVTR